MEQKAALPARIPGLGSIRPRPRRRLIIRSLLGVVLGLALALVVIVATVAWQATRGGISLNMLRDTIETAVRQRLPPNAQVTIGETALSFDFGQGVVLLARDLHLGIPGAADIRAKELSTLTSLRALIDGRIDFSSVAIGGLDIGISLPAGLVSTHSGGDMVRSAALGVAAQVLAADKLMRAAGLMNVALNDVTLHVQTTIGLPGPALAIEQANWRPASPDESVADLQIADAAGDWHVRLERQQLDVGTTLAIAVDGLPVASLDPDLGDNAGSYYHSSIGVQAKLTIDEAGGFSTLGGTLSTAPGALSITGRDHLDNARSLITFFLPQGGDQIAIESGEIDTHTGRIVFDGIADLSEPGGVNLVGRIREGTLPTADTDHAIALTGGGLAARVDYSDRALSVERLQVVTADGAMSVIGQASLGGTSPGVSLALSVSEMPAATVRALWPPFVAVRARQWVDANVVSGTLGPATLQVSLPPQAMGPRARDHVLPNYALVGSLPFHEAAIRPLPSFPLMEGAEGAIEFANATVLLRSQSGVIEVPGRGTLQAGGTTFAIPELGRTEPRADLHLELAGPAAALAALSNTPPLSIAENQGIKPDSLSGDAQLSLDASIALFGGSMDDIKPTFRLALTDFSSTAPIENRLIAAADIVLEGNPLAFTVKGDAVLDGVQASVDLILGKEGSGQSDVTLTLDDKAREQMGLGLDWLIQGPVQASVRNAGTDEQLIALDLKDARISLSFLGWEKGAGVPATASFLMTKTEEGTRLSDFIVAGGGFSVQGEVAIDANGELSRLELSHAALRPGDDLAGTVVANGDGYDVDVKGGALDARGILRTASEGLGEKSDLGAIHIAVDIGAVTGENDVVLSNVSGSLTVNGAGLDRAALKGKVVADETFEWTLGKENGARTLRVVSDNAGALIRFAGIYPRISGGNMILDYSGPVGETGNGVLLLRDFSLSEEPALASAVESARQAAEQSEMLRPGDASTGEMTFSQLRVPFTQKGWVISIEDAALRGTMLGATAEGTVNVPDGRLAITGTFIPAFGINNIAGSIPILGTILGGGRDEGLVGITYKLFGPLDAPEMTMNPMSAIAPGIFRKIFEYQQ